MCVKEREIGVCVKERVIGVCVKEREIGVCVYFECNSMMYLKKRKKKKESFICVFNVKLLVYNHNYNYHQRIIVYHSFATFS